MGRLHFPTFLGDMISPMGMWTEECVTSAPRQLSSLRENLFPTPLTPNLCPIWAVGLKELWWRFWWKPLGSEHCWRRRAHRHCPPHVVMYWESSQCYVKALKVYLVPYVVGYRWPHIFWHSFHWKLVSLSPVPESGLDCDCFDPWNVCFECSLSECSHHALRNLSHLEAQL